MAHADDRIAAALIEHGRLGEAVERLRHALGVWEVIADEERIAYATFRLGWTLVIAEEPEEALEHLGRAREAYHRRGDVFGAARCDEEAATALSMTGDRRQALRLLRRAVSALDAVGADEARDVARGNLAAVLERDGKRKEARRVLEQVWDAARERGDAYVASAAATRLAVGHLRAGRTAEARALLDEAAPMVDRDDRHEGVHHDLAVARCLLAEDRAAEAGDLAEAVLDRLAGSDLDGARANAHEVLADAAEARGDGAAEEHHRIQAVLLHLRARKPGAARRQAERVAVRR